MIGWVVVGTALVVAGLFTRRVRRARAIRSEAHLLELAAALGRILDEAAAADRVGVRRTEVVAGRDAGTAVTSQGVVLALRVDREARRFTHEIVIAGVGARDARWILSAIAVLLLTRISKLSFATRRAGRRAFGIELTLDQEEQRALDASRLELPRPSATATLESIRCYETFLSPCALWTEGSSPSAV